MATVWSVNSGWVIDGTMGMGMGGSVPIVELGCVFDGVNIVVRNRFTAETAMYQGTGLGVSIGAGLNPFNFSGSGPTHQTLNNQISTWPDSKLTVESFVGALYIFGANAEIASGTQAGQVWYFRGVSNYYPPPFGSVAAAVVGVEGASTELLAGSFSCTRYNITLVQHKKP